MDAARYIKARKAKRAKKRRPRNRDEYIASTTFGAGKALHYGVLTVNDLAYLRKKCCIYSPDFVFRGIYLLRWNGRMYLMQDADFVNFPLIMTAEEYRKRTGKSAYENIIRINSCG